jgi:hypothetical protein
MKVISSCLRLFSPLLSRPHSIPTRSYLFPLSISCFFLLKTSFLGLSLHSTLASTNNTMEIDPEYPGTALQRMYAVHERVRSLNTVQLSTDWQIVRRNLLWAGGLRDLPDAVPGKGYTGHSFNDYNHCDLTTMLGSMTHNENDGRVRGM